METRQYCLSSNSLISLVDNMYLYIKTYVYMYICQVLKILCDHCSFLSAFSRLITVNITSIPTFKPYDRPHILKDILLIRIMQLYMIIYLHLDDVNF